MTICIGDKFKAHGIVKTVVGIEHDKLDSKFDIIRTRWEGGEDGNDYRHTVEDTSIYERLSGNDISEIRVTDPKTGGQKGKKPEAYAYVPTFPLAEVARVYGMGAEKYEPWNWARGYAWSLSLSAMQRHIEAFKARTPRDSESGLHHLAHACFHLFALMEFERLGLGTDDRQPIPGAQPTQEQDE